MITDNIAVIKLPNKQSFFLILFFSIIAYCISEYEGIFSCSPLSDSFRLLFVRAGTFFSYIGAVVGGAAVLWDHLAKSQKVTLECKRAIESVNLKSLEASMQELNKDYSAQCASVRKTLESIDLDLKKVDEYQVSRDRFIKASLVLVFFGVVVQLFGSSDREANIFQKIKTCSVSERLIESNLLSSEFNVLRFN